MAEMPLCFRQGLWAEAVWQQKVVPVLTEVLRSGYYPDDSNRRIINEEYHQYIFIQEDRFKLLSGVARMNKGKSHFNGDNFLISRLECGKAIAAIADGMGSGKRAYIESRMVIELMENCIDAGFDEKASIDLINSAYIAGGGTGNPVTMDMSVIDCQSGYMHCMKLVRYPPLSGGTSGWRLSSQRHCRWGC